MISIISVDVYRYRAHIRWHRHLQRCLLPSVLASKARILTSAEAEAAARSRSPPLIATGNSKGGGGGGQIFLARVRYGGGSLRCSWGSCCLSASQFTASFPPISQRWVLICHLLNLLPYTSPWLSSMAVSFSTGGRNCRTSAIKCKNVHNVFGICRFPATQAYQYTSITSVTLLLCWTIPWAIILTWFVLRTHYCQWQLLGAAVCVVGLVLAVLSDGMASGGGGRNPLLGDILVIAGTCCFALSNVGVEFCVKKKDLVEVLAMLGVFGVLVDVCEISIFERKYLASVNWTPSLIALVVVFGTAKFLATTMAAFLLKKSGATLLNLSILTSNMWAALIRFFFYNQQVNWLYCLAFSCASVGLIIYSLNDCAISTTETTKDDLEATVPYLSLSEENSTCGAEFSVEVR